jgi:uncharacterized membrane protein YeaQ/YmgE (transglycosylase-associated protein family)
MELTIHVARRPGVTPCDPVGERIARRIEMGIISWIILGAVVGVGARLVFAGQFRHPGPVTVSGAILGALVGGGIFSLIASRGVSGLDAVSLLLALAGAALVLAAIRKPGYTEPRTPQARAH